MSTELSRRVTEDPNYQTLIRKRSRLAWTLTAIMLVVYYGFIVLIAFWPQVLAIRIGEGATTLGFPLGLAVIFTAIGLTGVYVWKANGEFERLSERVRAGARS